MHLLPSVARAAVGVALAALTAGSTVAVRPGAAQPIAGCDAVPLLWVNHAQADADVLEEAAREATRIWAPTGVRLAWSTAVPGRPVTDGAVLVVVRARLTGHPEMDVRVHRRATLGRLVRVTHDRPSRLIELALPAVTATVLREWRFGQPIASLPDDARRALIGRGLGRVAAHEIGHWLFGREHASEGLMRASIRRRDLVADLAPAIPRDWPEAARSRLRALRPCPAIRPVHPQPVTD